MNVRLIALAAALLFAAGGVLAWQQGLFLPVVSTGSVSTGPSVQAVYATAVVEPVRWAKVGPTATGRLVSLEVAEGQRVEAGTVLARLDDREARGRVAELEARLNYLSEQVRRLGRLRESGVSTQTSYDQALSDLDQSKAAITQAQKRLSDLTLRSPLGGIVLRREGEIGETVKDGTTLFWVGDPSALWAVADVDEDDIGLIKGGQRVLVRADSFPDRTDNASVGDITPLGDPSNRTFRVRIPLPSGTPFRVGMTVEVNIIVRETPDAVLAPADAVKGGRAFIVRDGRVRAASVETGVVGARKIEIRRGLSPGDVVVLNPPATLSDGAAVRSR